MTIVNGYLTVDEFSGYLASANNAARIDVTNRVGDIENAITAASRDIDAHCKRIFYTGSTTARVFAARDAALLLTDDLHTITAVRTDTAGDGTFDTTWAASDYQTEPLNGVVDGEDGWPVTCIRAIGNYRFPVSAQARVEITATWGWASVPATVKQACFIQSHTLLERPKTSPSGVLGLGDVGVVRVNSIDRHAEKLLSKYRNVL